ncbi:MAG: phosphoribosylanthranilate isomerase [Gammaproteobacteria bacterium]|nr:phosphoribosylanthranilate isomerase [Gammaproteobacteria bacterium]
MNLRTRVKICGITRPEDALAAARLGVDAIGLVFYENSPRHLSIEQAQAVCQALPGFVTVVSLFLNPEPELVKDVLASVPVDLLQFHGTESGDFCRSFDHPYIKALGMAGEHGLVQRAIEYADARGVLLDSHETGAAGGTGETFDWHSIPEQFRQSIILAGGLNPQNVAEAIVAVRPYAVDLSSGVEAAPGIKDASLMVQLMKEVKRVDCENG